MVPEGWDSKGPFPIRSDQMGRNYWEKKVAVLEMFCRNTVIWQQLLKALLSVGSTPIVGLL